MKKMLKFLRPLTTFFKKDFMKLGGDISTCTSSPQIQFSRPVDSRLRTFFKPKRDSELLLELVDSNKEMAGKGKPRIKQWIGDGFKPDEDTQRYLGFLLHMASQERNTEYLMALLSTITKNRMELTEPHFNAMLLSMDAHGWHDMVKANFREMRQNKVKLRVETMLHLAKSAAWREDFEFAVELMRSYLAEGMYGSCKKEHFPMDVVVDKCVGMGEMGVQLVEQVLEWHRMMKVNLTKNMADSIIKWIQSLEGDHQLVTKTQILPDGHCQCCGHKLETVDISQDEHSSLLAEVEKVIIDVEKKYYAQEVFQLGLLKELLQTKKFGAVLDGMNIALAGMRIAINIPQLVEVAKQLVVETDLPVLIILRWYCIRNFPIASKFKSQSQIFDKINEIYKTENIQFYFVHNFSDDDLYTIYSALASGQDTFFVSNDRLGDKRVLLPAKEQILYDRWRQTRQIRTGFSRSNKSIHIKVPLKYSGIVQCSEEGQWHLPYIENDIKQYLCIKYMTP